MIAHQTPVLILRKGTSCISLGFSGKQHLLFWEFACPLMCNHALQSVHFITIHCFIKPLKKLCSCSMVCLVEYLHHF
jgi:hypothetical protein